jgi:mannose-6-phosphate isomerase-like protein (cupin superfamily)
MKPLELPGYVGFEDALQRAEREARRFAEVFRHGTLVVELYAPRGKDPQSPHARDEVYIVARGSGVFFCDGKRGHFQAGDFLFAPAGIEHRFEEFTEDFATWVLFYGPEGGERAGPRASA